MEIRVSLKINESAYAHSCFPLGLWTTAQSRRHPASRTDAIFLHLFQELSFPCHLIKDLVFKQLTLDSACFWWIGHGPFGQAAHSKSWGAETTSLEAEIGSRGREEAVPFISSTGSRTAHLSTAEGQPFPASRSTRTHLQNNWSFYHPVSPDSFWWVSHVSIWEGLLIVLFYILALSVSKMRLPALWRQDPWS